MCVLDISWCNLLMLGLVLQELGLLMLASRVETLTVRTRRALAVAPRAWRGRSVVGGMVHCERRCELLKAAHAFAVLVVPSKLQELGVTPIARAPPKPLPTLY